MLLYFGVTLFVSAFLLFLVQPMIGKMILPRLGGTPAVWNTCMVFFQMVLLVGYAYTHSLSSWQRKRVQIIAQSFLLFVPLAVLPFSLGSWTPPTESNPVFDVLWLLLGLVGLPFFVVSTSAPLLQKWFGQTGHPAAKDPYFLYGASNLGSMLALLLYPVLIEPYFGVTEGHLGGLTQVQIWTAGYFLMLLLVLGCAIFVWRSPAPAAADAAVATVTTSQAAAAPATAGAVRSAVTATKPRAPQRSTTRTDSPRPSVAAARDPDRITLWRRLRWIGLAAAPSSLMLGVTTYMTTDIAAVPFFWVLPLALYLLTFILVFARWPVVWTDVPHTIVVFLQPCAVLFLAILTLANLAAPTWAQFTLHLGAFLLTALLCHGELAKDRPTARHLTEFYLLMSFGGMLGGLFNALVAPLALPFGIVEYPLALVLACLLRPNLVGDAPMIPGDSQTDRPTVLGWALNVCVPLALAGVGLTLVYFAEYRWQLHRKWVLALVAVLIFSTMMRPLRFGLAFGLLWLAIGAYDRYHDTLVYEGRGFFGLLRVRAQAERVELGEDVYEDRVYHTLIHGGINHGRQIVRPAERRRDLITYFHPTNGVGDLFRKVAWNSARVPTTLIAQGDNPLAALVALAVEPPYQFSWDDTRLPAAVIGQGALDPLAQLVALHSEPPYAVLGLGTGSLAAHARPLQTMRFYEIDPLVRDLSLPRDDREPIFSYVQDAHDRGADIDIIMGDGRLRLKQAPVHADATRPNLPKGYYHIIALDAFSSDAIPVHLLTKEAVQDYLDALADGGVLLFNATNRYVTIQPVLDAIARELDLDCLTCPDYADNGIPDKFGADWVVLQRKPGAAGFRNGGPPIRQRLERTHWFEVTDPRLRDYFPTLPGPIWTDDYSNLLGMMRWK